MADQLDAYVLLEKLPKLLPSGQGLKSPQDALVALQHTIFTVLGFRLVSVDETSSPKEFPENVLSDNWSLHGPGSYTLRYKHDQSSLEFLLKISKLGGRTLFNAIAIESDRIASLDVQTSDFTSEAFFPYSKDSQQTLVHGFISSARVSDFANSIKLKIIPGILPGLRKGDFQAIPEPEPETSAPSQSFRQPPQPARPHVPSPPFEPEHPSRSHFPPENPLAIGRRDLDPFHQGQNPFAPPPLFPPGGGGDGMYVGPDHPIFGMRDPARRDRPGRGPWAGDGFLPPLGAPPGARFDPVIPGNSPWPGPGRGGFGPGRGNPRAGDPDNDEFLPPGAGDMYM
ncbi:hypothetical protein SISSUDRAFT_1040918 [Sistotremastrum suecicum HHB10207 ss-3]|uniref:Uncharacterized protein n=1 Tax=Sistotremastrum suecicum HHB10207 ss-3 TaxID=1314776 RepID=A0A166HS07_9AGAM|nr:hypothetical protein SISSUDRAFT_1040918 [Sistotremastrum suecicum HHB10207 ss-3]